MIGIALIVAIMIFFWLKNKQDNRMLDRRDRMEEKQEELLEMLRRNNEKKDNDNDN